MKFKFVKSDTDEVVVYAKSKNDIVKQIQEICEMSESDITLYDEGFIKKVSASSIECFFTYGEKVYALYEGEKYLVKKRLYELSEEYNDTFIYINQGCLANLLYIDNFDCSIVGTLLVYFKSGYKDYASRRQIKNIKERLGIRK